MHAHSSFFAITTLGLLLLPGCSLIGVEPDEIDFAVSETGALSSAGGTDSEASTSAGTGDGDGSPGDGDGSPGDGDGEPDPTTTATTTGGDGDGDGDGDGTGGEAPCEALEAVELVVGDNPIDIPAQPSELEASCGATGPELLLRFTAPGDGLYAFTLGSDAFAGVLYTVGPSCFPLDELVCALEGVAIEVQMIAGDIVYLYADSDANPGPANVTVVGP